MFSYVGSWAERDAGVGGPGALALRTQMMIMFMKIIIA